MNINFLERKNKIAKKRIERFLRHPFLSKYIEIFNELDSTNEHLKRRAKDGAPDWSVAIADSQSAGKGRMDRTFYSPGGSGIYMSVLLRPDFSSADTVFLTVTAAVAVRNALHRLTGEDIKIKWINDLFLKGKKICGILCESSFSAEQNKMDYLIVGIGINVHDGKFPEELQSIAGHLTDKRIDRNQVVSAILDEFYNLTHPLDRTAVLEAYKAFSCVLGREVEVYDGSNAPYHATAVDINEDAHLIVRTADGSSKALCSGEVRIRL